MSLIMIRALSERDDLRVTENKCQSIVIFENNNLSFFLQMDDLHDPHVFFILIDDNFAPALRLYDERYGNIIYFSIENCYFEEFTRRD